MKDEWDTELLHVTYDTAEVTIEKISEIIRSEGFESEVRARDAVTERPDDE